MIVGNVCWVISFGIEGIGYFRFIGIIYVNGFDIIIVVFIGYVVVLFVIC